MNSARGWNLPRIQDEKPGVIKPGHVSDDPIDQARYDALFASTGPGLEGTSGLSPSAGNAAVTRMWIEPEWAHGAESAGGRQSTGPEPGRAPDSRPGTPH